MSEPGWQDTEGSVEAVRSTFLAKCKALADRKAVLSDEIAKKEAKMMAMRAGWAKEMGLQQQQLLRLQAEIVLIDQNLAGLRGAAQDLGV